MRHSPSKPDEYALTLTSLHVYPERLEMITEDRQVAIHQRVFNRDHNELGKPLPYDMVKTRIADYLHEKVRRKAITQYIHTLISQAKIDKLV
ncbi:MAG: hypothetical protein ACI8O8_002057 [Oleiphilaceae bacterium]